MRRASRSLAVIAAVLSAAPLLPAVAPAQGRIIPRPCAPGAPGQPRPVRPPCAPAPGAVQRARSDVRVTLADRVLHYEIREAFVNHGGALGEADYIFPLPAGAAFQELQLQIGDEMVSGEVLDAREARRVYEDIVRQQRDPALVEWMGRGLLRARIFPIAPGETKRVVVRYAVVAPREGDALRVDYDAGGALAAPRPPVSWGGGPVRVQQRDRWPADDDGDVDRDDHEVATGTGATLLLRLPRSAGLGTPYSPTHRLDVRERGDWREVTVRDAASGPATVLLPVRRGRAAAIGVLAHRPSRGEDGFALVTVAPPEVRAAATPRDVVFVVDVSGSMSGEKLVQAKAAGHQLLATLDRGDRFRVIAFATDVRSFQRGWTAATPTARRDAGRFLDGLDASGSTNISGALVEALDVPATRGRLPLVLFVTDGAPTVGERDPDAIARQAAALRGGARVFTFGVGRDVNAALLEQLALDGGGTAQFVRPEEDVERAVAVVASRLTSPLVTDVRVSADGVRLLQHHPRGTIDLFAGQDLVLLARYRGDGPATVRVEGVTAQGPVRWTTRVDLPAREPDNAFVARLWATQRIGWLSAERRRAGPSTELDDEIRALGLRYGLPTELSSYLVLEPGMALARDGRARLGAAVGASPAPSPPPVVQGGVRTGGAATMPASAPQPVRPEAAERAFAAAKAASDPRAARSLGEMVVTSASGSDATAADGNGNGEGAVRQVAGRRFVMRGGTWTDVGHGQGSEVVRVRAFGAAYFRLLELIPDLREAFAIGDRVLVAGRSISVEVAPDAPDTLDLSTLARVERDW
ncbi:MAG: VIT domain-containing protein [Gemmatimonadaceae bacterium]